MNDKISKEKVILCSIALACALLTFAALWFPVLTITIGYKFSSKITSHTVQYYGWSLFEEAKGLYKGDSNSTEGGWIIVFCCIHFVIQFVFAIFSFIILIVALNKFKEKNAYKWCGGLNIAGAILNGIYFIISIITLIYFKTRESDSSGSSYLPEVTYKYMIYTFIPFLLSLAVNIVYYVYKSRLIYVDDGTASEVNKGRKEIEPEETIKKMDAEQRNLDVILSYKELLDRGVITQEEFEVKKKQILGL